MKNPSKYTLPFIVFCTTAFFLSFVQWKVENPLLLLERFVTGGGWIEIFLLAGYAGMVAWFMQDPSKSAKWRRTTWLLFSIVFFSQLIIGITVSEKFLMTGELHLPIPMMILSGPIYRGEFSVMTILFLSTVVLSGPAWCSHICYFGALDNFASGINKKPKTLGKIWNFKLPILAGIILLTIVLRILQVEILTATLIAAGFGIAGILIMLIFSSRTRQMTHCLVWCPIGTVVAGLKWINPTRLIITKDCTQCMKCTTYCKYDALKSSDIQKHKPAASCTLCGDCISSCNSHALQYKIFQLNPVQSRNIYLGITITLHAITLGLARI